MSSKLPYEATGNMIDTHPCIVYDVEGKRKLAEFDSIKKCADFLGILPQRVMYALHKKGRNKTNKLGLVITIRSKPKNNANTHLQENTGENLVH